MAAEAFPRLPFVHVDAVEAPQAAGARGGVSQPRAAPGALAPHVHELPNIGYDDIQGPFKAARSCWAALARAHVNMLLRVKDKRGARWTFPCTTNAICAE